MNINEWESMSEKLDKEMKEFDEGFRRNNNNHKCKTKIVFSKEEWYCNHLVSARIKKFEAKMDEEFFGLIELSN